VIYGLFHRLLSTDNFCLGPIEDDLGFGCGAVKHGAQHAAVFLTEFSILSWRLLCFYCVSTLEPIKPVCFAVIAYMMKVIL
jgi:hypothetical protein